MCWTGRRWIWRQCRTVWAACWRPCVDSVPVPGRCWWIYNSGKNHLSRDMWFPTMWHFDKCNLLLSLETPNGVQSVAQQSKNTQATSKGSDQTARTRRLIWGFAGRTYHIVGNIMHWLILTLGIFFILLLLPADFTKNVQEQTEWIQIKIGVHLCVCLCLSPFVCLPVCLSVC